MFGPFLLEMCGQTIKVIKEGYSTLYWRSLLISINRSEMERRE